MRSKAGADMLAPSAIMDGHVKAIRAGPDNAGFEHIAILAHAIKLASPFYVHSEL